MKRFILVFAVLICMWICGQAEGYPESEHPYANNTDQIWTYTHPTDADYLAVTFSDETELESGRDYIYLIDSNGESTRYSGTDLSGRTICVPGNSFSIRLTSSYSQTYYGFSITNIVGLSREKFDFDSQFTIVSGHVIEYSGSKTDLIIPSIIYGVEITGIGKAAFEGNTTITSVTIPDSVTSIADCAFSGCTSLSSIEIPDSVTSIGYDVFGGCTSLSSITIPDSVTSVESSTFSRCTSLSSIVIPGSVISLTPENSYSK